MISAPKHAVSPAFAHADARERGHANRGLRVLELADPPADGAEVVHGEKVVGRVTSAVPGLALAYVRVEVPEDAELTVEDRTARQLH